MAPSTVIGTPEEDTDVDMDVDMDLAIRGFFFDSVVDSASIVKMYVGYLMDGGKSNLRGTTYPVPCTVRTPPTPR
jgi:hypothetical protein